jgi:hypothetical protein
MIKCYSNFTKTDHFPLGVITKYDILFEFVVGEYDENILLSPVI